EVPNTGSWETFESAEADLSSVTGIHTVYLLSTDNGTYNGDVDWIEFSTGSSTVDSDTWSDTGLDTDVDSETSTDPVFHIFLLLGQSNMAGFPKALDADKVKDDRIKVLGYDNCSSTGRIENQWATASPPLHECWNGAIGPGDYFAKTMIGHYKDGDTIGLVPCAISGEKIETFMKDIGTKYDWIVDRAKLAQQAGGVIDGILFHQGESNNTDTDWPGHVSTLIGDLKADLGLQDIPFLAGELLIGGSCEDHNIQVNRLPDFIDNAHIISSTGLLIDPADTLNVHFGHDAQVEFGKRYAAEMIKDLGL
ncbi:MAG: carbohydrate-binding protein, partial [Deltaproteobacteria bacterium]|nr:carbohydrate-binding protein [Deltaproteobacteria bacterium]